MKKMLLCALVVICLLVAVPATATMSVFFSAKVVAIEHNTIIFRAVDGNRFGFTDVKENLQLGKVYKIEAVVSFNSDTQSFDVITMYYHN